MSLLGLDPVVGLLVKLRRPLTKENWLALASTDPSADEQAELLSDMPIELRELDEGQALPVEEYVRAREELPEVAKRIDIQPSPDEESEDLELGKLRLARWQHQNEQLLSRR